MGLSCSTAMDECGKISQHIKLPNTSFQEEVETEVEENAIEEEDQEELEQEEVDSQEVEVDDVPNEDSAQIEQQLTFEQRIKQGQEQGLWYSSMIQMMSDGSECSVTMPFGEVLRQNLRLDNDQESVWLGKRRFLLPDLVVEEKESGFEFITAHKEKISISPVDTEDQYWAVALQLLASKL